MPDRKVAVIAFGGNALIREGEPGLEQTQMEHATKLAAELVGLVGQGYRLLLVHGNGPQVGNSLIRMEESVAKVPPLSLHTCVAETQGSIGCCLELALRSALGNRGEVVTVFTPVEVSEDDPRIDKPSKPVGPFYSPYRADHLVRVLDWDMVEDAGRGYRRVVPSPKPIRVLNAALVDSLLDRAGIVIAGGGGGVPVARIGDRIVGVEAVIDKDYTAALLAVAVRADLFLILTAVDHVRLRFGKPDETPIDRMTVAEAERYLAEGHFPPGSMGPKIEAGIAFATERGGEVLITSVEKMAEAFAGRAGTRIVSNEKGNRS
ncbi:MAG: carbamate kinase [Planctomycetes bacterium]|jgi:carbamate kinase|nr:carbamate kinase [Planctomycetota bacterium]